MGKKRIFPMLVIILLVISIVTNVFLLSPLVFMSRADPGDIDSSWDNSTTLNVSVLGFAPRVNWFGFQYNDGGTWSSRRNAQIDVDNSAEYRFVVNISSDQGWDDIDFINITAWHDNGSEDTTYNYSSTDATNNLGGNRNMRLTYENVSGVAFYNMTFPNDGDEVTKGSMSETISSDGLNGTTGYTECYNLTFSFTPSYQFRYAPGYNWGNNTYPKGQEGNWSNLDDIWSWNFNISIIDSGEDNSDERSTTWVRDEFGVYSYTSIVNCGWPVIHGTPGTNATADSNIAITTRSNGNYSLSVNVSTLIHQIVSGTTMSNETVYVRGGTRTESQNFTHESVGAGDTTSYNGGAIYLYGGSATANYEKHEVNDTSKITGTPVTGSHNDPSYTVEYACDIPPGTLAGLYKGTIFYHLRTHTN